MRVSDSSRLIRRCRRLSFHRQQGLLYSWVIPTFALNMKFGVWTVEDILPSGQDAVKLLGQNIGLFLPLDIDGKVKNFLFTFKITQTGD